MPSPQNEIMLSEIYDQAKMSYCLRSLSASRNEFKNEFFKRFYDETGQSQKANKSYLDQLQNVFLYCASNNYSKTVLYKTSKNDKEGTGRLYAQTGVCFQWMPRELRNFLVPSTYRDIDIVNCEPNLWRYVCSLNEILCPVLTYYCENREEILAKEGLVKQDIIILLNKDTNYAKKGKPFYQKLIGEIASIKNQIIKKNNLVIDEKEKNCKSKAIYNLTKKVERQVVDNAMNPFRENGTLRVPMFDGFMIETEEEIDIDAINSSISNDMKPFIKFAEKPIEVPETKFNPDISELALLPTYEESKDAFENHYFKCLMPLGYYVERDGEINSISTSSLRDEAMEYKIRITNDEGKYKEDYIYRSWMEDTNKRTYKRVEYRPFPDKEKPRNTDYYNIAKPYKVWDYECEIEEDLLTEVQMLWMELLGNLTNSKEADAQFIHRLFCRKLASPNEVIGVMPNFFGINGSGKDTIGLTLGALLGKNRYVCRDDMGSFCGNDNGSFVKTADVVCFNETEYGDSKKYKEKIKATLTAEKVEIRQKYEKGFTRNNNILFMITTNNATHIERKDRRQFMVQSSDKLCVDINPEAQNFWDKYYDMIGDGKKLFHLFHALLKEGKDYVAEGWEAKKERYDTEIVKEMKEVSTPKEIEFIKTIVFTGSTSLTNDIPENERRAVQLFHAKYDKAHNWISVNDLEEVWGEYFMNSNTTFKMTNTLWPQITKFNLPIKSARRTLPQQKKKTFYIFDVNEVRDFMEKRKID